jgi:hypothetical protein
MAWSQRDQNLAVGVASSLQCHGVADLLDRKGRSDRDGELAGKDRVGDPVQGVRFGVAAAGRAHSGGRVGPAAIVEIRSGGTPSASAVSAVSVPNRSVTAGHTSRSQRPYH